jgi:hypothetical protein
VPSARPSESPTTSQAKALECSNTVTQVLFMKRGFMYTETSRGESEQSHDAL